MNSCFNVRKSLIYFISLCYFNYIIVNDPLRGQVMNAEMLSNTVDVEMICDHVKYSLTVSRASPHTYALFMNDSCLEVDLHRLLLLRISVHAIILHAMNITVFPQIT